MNNIAYKVSRFSAGEFFWILGLAVLIAAAFSSSLSYAKYFCLPFFILSMLFNQKLTKSLVLGPNKRVLCYLFIVVVSFVNIMQFSFQSIADLIFISIPILVVISSSNYKIKPELLVFISIFYVLFALIEGDASFDLGQNILLNSDFSNIEANACFLFFFMFIYFFFSGKKLLALFSVFGVLIFFRRTVVLGFLILFLMILAKKILGKNRLDKLTSPIVLVLVNLGLVFLFYLVATSYFDELVHELTGLSIGHFTQGRTTFLKGVYEYLGSDPVDLIVSGIGIGNTRPAVLTSTGLDLMLHNDIIKIFIENGIFVFSMFFYLLYRKAEFEEKVILLCFNVFLIFTNMFVYSDIVTIVFLLCGKLAIQSQDHSMHFRAGLHSNSSFK